MTVCHLGVGLNQKQYIIKCMTRVKVKDKDKDKDTLYFTSEVCGPRSIRH